ncbi:MAG: tyrosine-protein phosphatase [Christensenellaceae bacterium]|jgi:protein-tyrosine phosphatase|nr:tyrosine-protein phosphatase [Christensenellaceae bacterium]
MDRIINIRDIGGVPLENGRCVKRGLFFRSSALDKATQSDIAELKSYNLKLIVDFREEFEKSSNKVYTKLGVEYVNVPFIIDSARIVTLHKKRTPSSLVQFVNEDMCIAYRNIPFSNPGYRTLFTAIKNNTVPVLYHCTVGKDRTGAATGILLKMLGASYEAILEDYMKTRAVEQQLKADARKKFWPLFFMRNYVMKRMEPLFLTEESFIKSTFDAIEAKYPSYDEYFECEFGLTKDDIASMRERYTE